MGDGDFVTQVLKSAEEVMEKRYLLRSQGMDLDFIALRVSQVFDFDIEEVWAKGKSKRVVEARSLLCYWAVRELGGTMTELACRLQLSVPSVSDSATRGKGIAAAREYHLIET